MKLTLREPPVLGGGVALFLLLGSLSLASAPGGAPDRQRARAGPLAVEATLSQAALVRGEEGSVFLHVRLRGEGGGAKPLPLDVALLLDVAADPAQLAITSRACLEVSRHLGPDDRITVVSFAEEARTVLAPGGRMGELAPGTGRDLGAGLARAAEELRRGARPGAVRRIVLATGGRPDRGVTARDALRAQVAQLAAEGISLSVLGLGEDFDAGLLKALSDAGGGSYHQVDRAERVAGIYAAELRALHALAARDVRVAIEPAPGVTVEEVVEWATAREEAATTVGVGDFERGRSAKVIARLRVPAAAASCRNVATVSVTGADARSGAGFDPAPLGLGVQLSRDRGAAAASLAPELVADLDDARVVLALREAEERARRGDAAGTRAALGIVRRLRPTLEYRAADGQVERTTVDALEEELVAVAASAGQGVLASLASGARALVDSVSPQPRKHGNEAAAIGALKTIATSQSIFREGDKEQDGNLDYGMLGELSSSGLVDSVLGSGTKQGYVFRAQPSTSTSEFLWYATASPAMPGTTGERYFFTNQAGVIFYSATPIEVDPETCQPRTKRWDSRAARFVESYVVPTGK